MGYQEIPLTLIESTLFILMVGDCLSACNGHNLPQYTPTGLTSLASSFISSSFLFPDLGQGACCCCCYITRVGTALPSRLEREAANELELRRDKKTQKTGAQRVQGSKTKALTS